MTAPLPPEVVEGWREMVARIVDPFAVNTSFDMQGRKEAYAKADAILSALPLGGVVAGSERYSMIMEDALEALVTSCEWFGQREAGESTTNSEAAIFQRLSNVSANIEGHLGLATESPSPMSDRARDELPESDDAVIIHGGEWLTASQAATLLRNRDELLERVVEALKPLANECDAVTKWNGDDPPTYSQILPPDNDWAPCFRTKYGDIRRAREALSLALGGRGEKDNSSVAGLPAHVADATATDTHNHSGKEE